MSYEWFIARRYLFSRRKQAFVSVITTISTLGITIGVMALVVAIALITGFQKDVQDKILGSTSHILVSDYSGQGISGYSELMENIAGIQGVMGISPVAYDTVLIKGMHRSEGAVLRGLDLNLEKKASSWLRELVIGNLPEENAKREGILLGRDLAFKIGAVVGDAVTVFASSSRLTPLGPMPKMKNFEVTGIYQTGLYEFDASTAVVALKSAQKIFNLNNSVNLIQIKINNIFKASEIRELIKEVLPTYIILYP